VTKAKKHHNAKDRIPTRTLLPLVAIGGSLAVTPAIALELGEAVVQSNLGQPLRASIAYALAPSEMLSNTCVSISAGRSTGGLPGIGPSTISITDRAILISGKTLVREPMVGARVTINCPYTPNLSREYMMFVDPAGVTTQPVASAAPVTTAEQPVASAAPVTTAEQPVASAAPVTTAEPVASAAPVTAAEPVAPAAPAARPEAAPQPVASAPAVAPRAAPPIDKTPIGQSTRYQVQVGDTLGEIVGRIENRSMKLWPAVNTVFAANPDAFIGNDPNKLKAGSWLTIPSFDGTAPVISAAPVETTAEPVAVEPALEPASVVSSQTVEDVATTTDNATVYEIGAFEETTAADSTADLKPGDIVVDNTVVETTETITIPDTQLEGPQTTATSPNVPTAIVNTGARGDTTSTFMWLVGGGLAIIIGLLLFGRRARSRFAWKPPADTAAIPDHDDHQDAIATDEAVADEIVLDDSPTAENLVLDADLSIGTGLSDGVEVDVADDFVFSATTELDIEFPFDPVAEDANGETDIIPPMSRDVDSILEDEVLPEDDDYEMSVTLDATKMPQPEDATVRDFQAVEVETVNESLSSGIYTINEEVDLGILEQDYEDELTATQALNMEVERAAAELANNRDDLTLELPVQSDDDTGEFEAAFSPDDTNALTVNMAVEDGTAEMLVANDDASDDMDVDDETVETKIG
jgi:hypothetical protein